MLDTSTSRRNARGVRSRASVVSIAAAALVMVPGCSMFKSSEGSAGGASSGGLDAGGGSECLNATDPADLDPAGAALAVVLDVSFSQGNGDSRSAMLNAAKERVSAQIDGNPAESAIVWAGTFDAASTTVNFDECLDGTVLVPRGNNAAQRSQKVSVEKLEADISTRFDALAETPLSKLGTDPIAAVSASIDRVKSAEIVDGGQREVDIYTDGLATTGCLALPETYDENDLDAAKALGESCADTGQLADGEGVSVKFLGVGRSSEAISTEKAVWINTALVAACELTGAECTSTESLEP